MADWTAIIIAALGIAGTLAATILANKNERKRHKEADRREDAATLRLKLEELYAEVERLEAVASDISLFAMRMATGVKPDSALPSLELARVRSSINLYFPECREALAEYDRQIAEDLKTMRQQVKESANPQEEAITTVLISRWSCFSVLAGAIHEQLDVRAESIGIGEPA